ncbi:hypothetical protein [Algivirga pacifica]|uniref:Type 1 periplasmic binding fold superfamily protein n=1 Tax=Algivirga pacifica TaxID=1162670 RepID=A0ABP9DCW2_9BACT
MFSKITKPFAYLLLGLSVMTFTACDDDDDFPEEENDLEVITRVTLSFTNDQDAGDVVTALAVDPDGAGIQDLEVLENIVLKANTTYTLEMELLNELDPNDVKDITAEVKDEDDEHQFFFAFTEGVFTTPTGNGNVDGEGEVNYLDQDGNGNPVGLETSWTAATATTGTFRVILKHQPGLKTATSTVNEGGTDIDVTFDITVE